MEQALTVSVGQCSERGQKERNQDFHGLVIPAGRELTAKGVAVALADGVTTSAVSHIAAETAVKAFLADYYCTSDAWSVRTAALSVIKASNGWLYSETQASHAAYDLDRGYVCTFSALVLKGRFAHVLHVGDSRVSRVAGDALEPLTADHRVVLSSTERYLGRALGAAQSVDVDYARHALAPGDVFVLSTDGVHEFVGAHELVALIRANGGDLDAAAREIVRTALDNGSDDNLTVQLVRVEQLPDGDAADFAGQADALHPAPLLEPPAQLDGYRLLRLLHVNDRSHIYLAADAANVHVALKIPAQTLRQEASSLRRLMIEEWIARRVSSPHVLKAHTSREPRSFLYVVTEYVDGQSLRQWMHDHPRPELEAVRGIVEQVVKGLRALHRKEMIHCDLRPENILIDRDGTVKIIDFGSVRVTGLAEAAVEPELEPVVGAVQYSAPEWLAGDAPTWRSDLFSLAVVVYEMLTGRLPYGAHAARVRSPAEQRALTYRSARTPTSGVPDWVDGALRKALHPDPTRRYDALSEFMHDLRVPNAEFRLARDAALLERNPMLFWQLLSVLLAAIIVLLLALR